MTLDMIWAVKIHQTELYDGICSLLRLLVDWVHILIVVNGFGVLRRYFGKVDTGVISF